MCDAVKNELHESEGVKPHGRKLRLCFACVCVHTMLGGAEEGPDFAPLSPTWRV